MKKRLAKTVLPGGKVLERSWHPSELLWLYMRGWRTGAGSLPLTQGYEQLPEYLEGYEDGVKQRVLASNRAMKRLKYRPSILRTQEKST